MAKCNLERANLKTRLAGKRSHPRRTGGAGLPLRLQGQSYVIA